MSYIGWLVATLTVAGWLNIIDFAVCVGDVGKCQICAKADQS